MTITRESGAVRLRIAGRADHRVRTLDEPYPDHRRMLAALPEVTVRVATSRSRLLDLLESTATPVCLRVHHGGTTFVTGADKGGATVEPAPEASGSRATGEDSAIWFSPGTLYPAISTAIGEDLQLDLRGPELPVTVRSADDGDLTTLVMPIAAPGGTAEGASR